MKPELFIPLLVLLALAVYAVRTRMKRKESGAGANLIHSVPERIPDILQPNDKIIVISDTDYTSIKTVLTAFCKMHKDDGGLVRLRLSRISDQEFAVSFPYDISFEIFCYLVNYLRYPIELSWTARITGWATTKAGDYWITKDTSEKKVMVFVPADDTGYDNVYMTTEDNREYKLGFAVGDGTQLSDKSGNFYTEPPLTVTAAEEKNAEDIC